MHALFVTHCQGTRGPTASQHHACVHLGIRPRPVLPAQAGGPKRGFEVQYMIGAIQCAKELARRLSVAAPVLVITDNGAAVAHPNPLQALPLSACALRCGEHIKAHAPLLGRRVRVPERQGRDGFPESLAKAGKQRNRRAIEHTQRHGHGCVRSCSEDAGHVWRAGGERGSSRRGGAQQTGSA